MAKQSPKFANVTVNAEADALARLLDNGYLRIYSGTQPATADTALSGNTLLAELRFAATSAAAASAGVLTFSAITSDTSADATGTAAFYRALKSDGTSVVMDGSVGTSSADLVLNSTAIQSGAQVDVTSFAVTVSKG
jgi:hypothetical protein